MIVCCKRPIRSPRTGPIYGVTVLMAFLKKTMTDRVFFFSISLAPDFNSFFLPVPNRSSWSTDERECQPRKNQRRIRQCYLDTGQIKWQSHKESRYWTQNTVWAQNLAHDYWGIWTREGLDTSRTVSMGSLYVPCCLHQRRWKQYTERSVP